MGLFFYAKKLHPITIKIINPLNKYYEIKTSTKTSG